MKVFSFGRLIPNTFCLIVVILTLKTVHICHSSKFLIFAGFILDITK